MELKFINRIWSMKVETQQCILVWHSEASGQLYKNQGRIEFKLKSYLFENWQTRHNFFNFDKFLIASFILAGFEFQKCGGKQVEISMCRW